MTMLLSIIVPTFKPQKTYFEECLFSLFNQTMFHYLYEVIVVLNGDIDTQYTDMILDIFAYKPAGLYCRLIKTDQAGVSNARNLGIDAAKGQYIGFVDDDDIVSSDYLEELCKISSRNIVGVSNVHTFRKTIEEKEDNFFACRIIQQRECQYSLFRNRAILAFPVAKLIHRDIIGNRRFNPRFKNGEDALFMTEISDLIGGFRFTKGYTTYYVRERAGSASRRPLKRGQLCWDTFMLIKAYVSIYLSSPFSYNFLLFASRIPGSIKGAIKLSRNTAFF